MSLADAIKNATVAIENNGGDFTPTENGGSFDIPVPMGSIQGNFTWYEGIAQVDITGKPFFVSCDMIQSKLTEYLQSQI